MRIPFRRRWLQFGLRTFLAATLVLGALLGWVAIKIEKARKQRAVIAAIERLGAGVESMPNRRPSQTWASVLWDQDQRLSVQAPAKRAETIECLKLCTKLEHLQLLKLACTDLKAADLADLGRLTELGTLAVFSAPIGDDVLAIADRLPNLAVLQLVNASASDAGLRKLGKAESLVMLVIIGSSKVSDDGLAELAGLRNLETLSLDCASVTDAALVHLTRLKKLQNLNLTGTSITAGGVHRLQQALPNCRIIGP